MEISSQTRFHFYHQWPLSLALSILLPETRSPRQVQEKRHRMNPGRMLVLLVMNHVALGKWFNVLDPQYPFYKVIPTPKQLLEELSETTSVQYSGQGHLCALVSSTTTAELKAQSAAAAAVVIHGSEGPAIHSEQRTHSRDVKKKNGTNERQSLIKGSS